MNPAYRLAAVLIAWGLWVAPFIFRRRGGRQKAVKRDPRARWGILLQTAAFWIVFAHKPAFWDSPFSMFRLILGTLLIVPALALVWPAVGNLGKQWRVDAGLNADHELVTNGAYRIVRHPIYSSMFAMLLSLTAFVGTLPGWPIALPLFILGIEIRTRVEDDLLRQRFGTHFTEWQRSVSAWLPFIR